MDVKRLIGLTPDPQITKYNRDLKSELVWILNGQKKVGLQMVGILNGT